MVNFNILLVKFLKFLKFLNLILDINNPFWSNYDQKGRFFCAIKILELERMNLE